MSESSGPMTWEPYKVKAGTVGVAFPGVEVFLAEDGEVCCRGGNVFVGYLDDPEKTAEALDADGTLHSGDIGEFDDEGYLRIVDRKKELIITAGGKNISPANLETALKTVPAHRPGLRHRRPAPVRVRARGARPRGRARPGPRSTASTFDTLADLADAPRRRRRGRAGRRRRSWRRSTTPSG